MHIDCPHCNKTTSPLIDKRTLQNKVVVSETKAICEYCRKPIELTFFMIKSLHSMKRFYDPKPDKAHQYFCDNCNAFTDTGIEANKAFCEQCKDPKNLTLFVLRSLLLSKGKTPDITSADLRTELERVKTEPIKEATPVEEFKLLIKRIAALQKLETYDPEYLDQLITQAKEAYDKSNPTAVSESNNGKSKSKSSKLSKRKKSKKADS